MDAAPAMKAALLGWWTSLRTSPPALDRRQWVIFAILAAVAAATRRLALAKTMWDWDEALFGLALRDYDVTSHHPHPPGFPLFIAVAKAVLLATGLEEFRSLQAVAIGSSLLLFPAMFLLARELRASFFTASASASLLAFLPNVWFFGGTAFSDVPSLVLSLSACALLLRGGRSNAAGFAGYVVMAIAVGFRPQNLMICFLPAMVALIRRPRGAVAGALVAAAVVVASFGSAAALSGGWTAYREALEVHERYIRETDSFLSESRPSLWDVADDFFYRPYRVPFMNLSIAILASAGVLRRRAAALSAVLIFGPFLLFAWLMLDFHSTSRFSIAYMPMYALLAAEGAGLLPRRVRAWTVAVVLAGVTWWMHDPLRVVRTTDSPPVAAARWIESEGPKGAVTVDPRLTPLAQFLLPGRELHVAPARLSGDAVFFREMVSEAQGAKNFTRPRAKLWRALARPRYFEVSVVPAP